jgi:hypothetical protein
MEEFPSLVSGCASDATNSPAPVARPTAALAAANLNAFYTDIDGMRSATTTSSGVIAGTDAQSYAQAACEQMARGARADVARWFFNYRPGTLTPCVWGICLAAMRNVFGSPGLIGQAAVQIAADGTLVYHAPGSFPNNIEVDLVPTPIGISAATITHFGFPGFPEAPLRSGTFRPPAMARNCLI